MTIYHDAIDAETHTPHYFKFSTNWNHNRKRLCGDCNRTYNDGNHTEVTVLKPFTNYLCETGGGYGHKSTYTGAYLHELRSPTDDVCICGQLLVEEDNEQWKLSWEMRTPYSQEWLRTEVVRTRFAATSQRDGLLALAASGEDVRNVQMQRID